MIPRLLLAVLCCFGAFTARAAEVIPEDRRIEALLTAVAAQKDAAFIRNGTTYDSATAVKFLRGKWSRQRTEIRTAEDFVVKIATKSSTTGQPYRLKFKDGREVDCADFLRTRLATLKAE